MTEKRVSPPMPKPEEVGYWYARLRFAGMAVRHFAPKLGYRNAQYEFQKVARELAPGDNPRHHDRFERLVLHGLQRVLPSVKPWIEPGRHNGERRQNTSLAALIQATPMPVVRTIQTPAKDVPRDVWSEDLIGHGAIEGLIRLGFLDKLHRSPHFAWPIGMVATAAFLRADASEIYDHRVTRGSRKAKTLTAIEGYDNISPRSVMFRGKVLPIYPALAVMDEPDIEQFFDPPLTKHDAFWQEISHDLQKFDAQRPPLIKSE